MHPKMACYAPENGSGLHRDWLGNGSVKSGKNFGIECTREWFGIASGLAREWFGEVGEKFRHGMHPRTACYAPENAYRLLMPKFSLNLALV